MKKIGLFLLLILSIFLNLLCVGLASAQERSQSDVKAELAKIDQIELFQLKPYPTFEEEGLVKWTKESLTAGLAKGIAFIATPARIKAYLGGKIRENKTGKEIEQKYFTPSEFDQLLSQAAVPFSVKFNGKITSKLFVERFSKTADALVYPIIDRVLEREGVINSKARNRWTQKIFGKFRGCLQIATHETHAEDCLEALLSSVGPNVGLAILHSKVTSEVKISDSAQSQIQVKNADKAYRECLCVGPDTQNIDLERCLLKGIESGISDYARNEVIGKLERDYQISRNSADSIWSQVKPGFEQCLKEKVDEERTRVSKEQSSPSEKAFSVDGKADYRSKFMECKDPLTLEVSKLTTQNLISNHESVQSAFLDRQVRDLQVQKYVKKLSACADQAKKNNMRTTDGLVDVYLCKDPLYNEVTRDVVSVFFKQAVEERLGRGPESAQARERVLKRSVSQLESCLPDSADDVTRNVCLRNSVAGISTGIADERMRKEIPSIDPKFFEKYPAFGKMRSDLSSSFQGCLLKPTGLPSDVSDTQARGQALDRCEYQLRKDIYFKVATTLVHESRKEDIRAYKAIKKGLTAVDSDYQKCVAKVPFGETYEISLKFCVSKYLTSVAKVIASNRLREGLGNALEKHHMSAEESRIRSIQWEFEDCLFYARDKDPVNFSFLVDEMGKCANHLEAKAKDLFAKRFGFALDIESRNDSSEARKARALVSESILCLADYVSDNTPGHPQVKSGIDDIAKIIVKTIDYDPTRAGSSLEKTFKEFKSDMDAIAIQDSKNPKIDPKVAKLKLFELLKKNGVLDQLVLSQLFSGISQKIGDAKLDILLEKRLLSKENMDRIFSGRDRAILDRAIDQIIRPVVVDGESPQGNKVKAAISDLEKRVATQLVESRTFGSVLIQDQLQSRIDDKIKNLAGVERIFAKLYAFVKGDSAFQWEKAAKTPEGQQAEDYIRKNMLMPIARGELTETDLKFQEASKKAEVLVRKAML